MLRRLDFVRRRGQSPADRLVPVEAFFWLALARAAVLIIPFRWTIYLLGLEPGDGIVRKPALRDPKSLAFARRAGRALRAVAVRTPWECNCLTKALAGIVMLRFRRIAATMMLGVNHRPNSGGMKAHAWLLAGEIVVTGAGPHRNYRLIATFAYNPKVPRPTRNVPIFGIFSKH